jgi:hypothetical protein
MSQAGKGALLWVIFAMFGGTCAAAGFMCLLKWCGCCLVTALPYWAIIAGIFALMLLNLVNILRGKE